MNALAEIALTGQEPEGHSMDTIVSTRIGTSPADSAGYLQGGPETMTTKTRHRRVRHAEQLARRSLKEAGSRRDVAGALGRSESTVSHEVTDRSHPTLTAAFDVFLQLNQYPGVSGRAFAEAAMEAVELRDIIEAETEVLVERGLYLMDAENNSDAVEDRASMVGPLEHAEALRVHASKAMYLAMILDALRYRNIDLHALYREQGAAS